MCKFQTVYEDSNFYVSKEHIFKQTIDIKHLDIQIFDYKGNSVNPNGIDYSFSIEFKVIQNAVLKLYKNINFRSNELEGLIGDSIITEVEKQENKLQKGKIKNLKISIK